MSFSIEKRQAAKSRLNGFHGLERIQVSGEPQRAGDYNKMTTTVVICGVALCLSQMPVSAQNENAARERLVEFARSRKPIREINHIQALKGADNISADDLKLVLRSHGDVLLKGERSKDKFWALSTFCAMITSSPDGKKLAPDLIPDLMSAVFELDAPTSKHSEIRDWDEVLIRAKGDRIGLLMNCLLDLSGKEGFEEMFNHFEREGQVAKTTILVERLPVRGDGEEYLDLLSEKLKRQQNVELKEVIRTSISRIRDYRERPQRSKRENE